MYIFLNYPTTIPKRSQHVPPMYIGVGPPPSPIADPVLIFTQAGEAAGAPGQPGAVEPQREREGCCFFVFSKDDFVVQGC